MLGIKANECEYSAQGWAFGLKESFTQVEGSVSDADVSNVVEDVASSTSGGRGSIRPFL